jgi:hypothetical protein
MWFSPGKEGECQGLKGIVVGVQGQKILDGIWSRARVEGLKVDEGCRDGTLEMLGVEWSFVLLDEGPVMSRL